ncbi:MAG TPA: transglutaminase domain-containing protein [Candidatus Brocadiia bacterium]|nr:transglutaminase domain-containing protein [Candidatus Brocadiia bacterium]
MLHFADEGRVLVDCNEEIWSWAQARKRFTIAPAAGDGELCLFLCEYPGAAHPLNVRVGRTELRIEPGAGPAGLFYWRTLPVPAAELRQPEVEVTLSCPAPAMTSWILAVDCAGGKGQSLKSVDKGRTWRPTGLGYGHALSGEYMVRLWTPGPEPRHPDLPFVAEDPTHPRLAELRGLLASRMGRLPQGSHWQRALALKDWLAAQWIHMDRGPDIVYGAWEAATLLEWTAQGKGHGRGSVIAMCVHFAVAFTQFATALGLPCRLAVSESPSITEPGGHCVPEVYCPELGKWAMLDPDVDMFPARNGVPAGAAELHDLNMAGRFGELERVYGAQANTRPPCIRDFWEERWPKGWLFRRWGILPRNDFFSRPWAFPTEHGRLHYHEPHFLWRDAPSLPPFRWHPYRSANSEDFLLAPV